MTNNAIYIPIDELKVTKPTQPGTPQIIDIKPDAPVYERNSSGGFTRTGRTTRRGVRMDRDVPTTSSTPPQKETQQTQQTQQEVILTEQQQKSLLQKQQVGSQYGTTRQNMFQGNIPLNIRNEPIRTGAYIQREQVGVTRDKTTGFQEVPEYRFVYQEPSEDILFREKWSRYEADGVLDFYPEVSKFNKHISEGKFVGTEEQYQEYTKAFDIGKEREQEYKSWTESPRVKTFVPRPATESEIKDYEKKSFNYGEVRKDTFYERTILPGVFKAKDTYSKTEKFLGEKITDKIPADKISSGIGKAFVKPLIFAPSFIKKDIEKGVKDYSKGIIIGTAEKPLKSAIIYIGSSGMGVAVSAARVGFVSASTKLGTKIAGKRAGKIVGATAGKIFTGGLTGIATTSTIPLATSKYYEIRRSESFEEKVKLTTIAVKDTAIGLGGLRAGSKAFTKIDPITKITLKTPTRPLNKEGEFTIVQQVLIKGNKRIPIAELVKMVEVRPPIKVETTTAFRRFFNLPAKSTKILPERIVKQSGTQRGIGSDFIITQKRGNVLTKFLIESDKPKKIKIMDLKSNLEKELLKQLGYSNKEIKIKSKKIPAIKYKLLKRFESKLSTLEKEKFKKLDLQSKILWAKQIKPSSKNIPVFKPRSLFKTNIKNIQRLLMPSDANGKPSFYLGAYRTTQLGKITLSTKRIEVNVKGMRDEILLKSKTANLKINIDKGKTENLYLQLVKMKKLKGLPELHFFDNKEMLQVIRKYPSARLYGVKDATKDVSKPFSRITDKNVFTSKGVVIQIKEPLIIKADTQKLVVGTGGTIQKTPLSKTFQKQIQALQQKQLNELKFPDRPPLSVLPKQQTTPIKTPTASVVMPSAFIGTGLYERTQEYGFLNREGINQNIMDRNTLEIKSTQKMSVASMPLQVEKSIAILDSSQRTNQSPKITSRTLQVPVQKFIQRTIQDQRERTAQVSRQRTRQRTITLQRNLLRQLSFSGMSLRSRIQRTPIPKPPKITTPKRKKQKDIFFNFEKGLTKDVKVIAQDFTSKQLKLKKMRLY